MPDLRTYFAARLAGVGAVVVAVVLTRDTTLLHVCLDVAATIAVWLWFFVSLAFVFGM
jgi:hypothetical protein